MSTPYMRAPHQGGAAISGASSPHAALLIDFDNVTMGMRSDLSKELKNLLDSDVIKGKVSVQRFKGLGEMNPLQLRETAMAEATRRLVQLTMDPGSLVNDTLDMLLSKKRAADRKVWLENKGDLAELV